MSEFKKLQTFSFPLKGLGAFALRQLRNVDLLWKQQPCVDHNVSILVAHEHAVHSNLAEPANRENAEWRPLPFRRSRKGAVPAGLQTRTQVARAIAGFS